MKLQTISIDESTATKSKSVRRKPMYLILAEHMTASKKVDLLAARLGALLQNSSNLSEERKLLASFGNIIREHGATESLMSCINAEDQLARCLGIAIPEINAINAQSVGISCCEAIEEKLACSCGLTCKFLNSLVDSVDHFSKCLAENSACQKETLNTVLTEIIEAVKYVKAEEFAKEKICGYAQPVFMDRVAAIKAIMDNIMNCDSCECTQSLMPYLKTLGYVVEQNTEVREETVEEAKATEPPKEEVLSAPVEEVDKSEEELEGPETKEETETAIPEPSEATDGLLEEEIAVMRWTPTLIEDACKSVISILDNGEVLLKLSEKVKVACAEAISNCNEADEKTPEVQAKLECCNRFASFLSRILQIIGSNLNGMVDQIVAMSTILKKFEAPKAESGTVAVPAEQITPEAPLADSCSKKGPRFAKKKLMAEAEAPKEEGTEPAVAPAESGDTQKEVTQEIPPDESGTVPEQPKPEEGAGPAIPPVEGGDKEKVEPEMQVPSPKDENDVIEETVIVPVATPTQPVEDPAPVAVPPEQVAVPAAPAEPVAPVVTEDPIVAPLTQDNVEEANLNEQSEPTEKDPSGTVPEQPAPKEGTEPAVAPAESGDTQKEVTQPDKVTTEQEPTVTETPAVKVEPLQNPETINQPVDTVVAKRRGISWL